KDQQIHVHVPSHRQKEAYASLQEIPSGGAPGLINACIRRVSPKHGFELTVSSEIPAGCGLAEDAALAVAVCAVCSEDAGVRLAPMAVAELASGALRDALGRDTGLVDVFSSALGGLQILEV